ncbi:hypothetical protein ACFWYW_59070 [Nonomuraea sp. NPDC059023]|uniref:hypothetical protein n=1 Tax=unclassified Nonomuraea TaxID=2593643 RepID=UPI003697799C
MDKPPTNRWKVTVGSEKPKSFRSETKAYEFVREHLPSGVRIVVHNWERGRWGLYEAFEERSPDDTPGAAERRMADN